MEMTMFLAGLWGPAMLAMGLGIFINRDHYTRLYRELGRESFAVLVFGLAAIAVGVAQINVHNTWETFPEMLVSLFGWLLLLKGAACAITPKWADRSGNWMATNPQMLTISGAIMLLVGAYLTWSVYFL